MKPTALQVLKDIKGLGFKFNNITVDGFKFSSSNGTITYNGQAVEIEGPYSSVPSEYKNPKGSSMSMMTFSMKTDKSRGFAVVGVGSKYYILKIDTTLGCSVCETNPKYKCSDCGTIYSQEMN